MNMKTEFRWLLICIDYDSEECFMKRNEMKWSGCVKRKKEQKNREISANNNDIKKSTDNNNYRKNDGAHTKINMNLDPKSGQ